VSVASADLLQDFSSDLRQKTRAMASPVKSQHVPNEIVLLIFRQLRKQDLKSVRIVCKLWSSLAVELLFDRIYISPHRENLEVFSNITNHPILSKSIRELVYDISVFTAEVTRLEYFDALCQQMRVRSLRLPRKHTFQTADEQVNEVLQYAKADHQPGQRRGEGVARLSNHRIVDRGHRAYLEYARQQQECYESGELLARLCLGLEKLPNLDAVVLGEDWRHYSTDRQFDPSILHSVHRLGCPLARTWNPLFLEPKTIWRDDDGHIEFFTVTRALSLTHKTVKKVLARSYLRLYQSAFDSNALMSTSLMRHTINALQDAETLSMRICSRPGHDTGSIDALPTVLQSMTVLKDLDLDMNKLLGDNDTLYTLPELFGSRSVWPHLSYLKVSSFAASETTLIRFLTRLRALRELRLENIELTSGSWESTIEGMRTSLGLRALTLDMPLRHLGGVDVWDELTWDVEFMDEKIERYVLYGGKNPLRVEPQG